MGVTSGATDQGNKSVRFLEPTTFGSKAEFAAALLGWLASSSADTIGDVGNFGGRPLLRIDLGSGRTAVLNADTQRSAVVGYLTSALKDGAEAGWRLVANNRGTFNKLVFGLGEPASRGWYCYLTPPGEQEEIV